MKKSVKVGLVLGLIAVIGGVLYIGLTQWRGKWGKLKTSPYINYPSLRPQIKRTVAVRFDPSYYYQGKRPQSLAHELSKQWKRAGVNLIFYRAYDPAYGAFYRTSYKYNQEGEFGKYNLLKYILKECHKRGIQVFGWFPVLNHRGAWEANPEWREKDYQGNYYSKPGLEYPLCSRVEDVKNWWYGFIKDFLKNYPQIDGLDLGEPVVSWSKGEACYCQQCMDAYRELKGKLSLSEIRAQPLSSLLKKSMEIINALQKKTSLTFVLSADSSGKIFNLQQLKDLTGFDLEAVLQASEKSRPDMICPELIWQQWKSQFIEDKQASSIFTPSWPQKAVDELMKHVDTPVEVVPHVEITDFPSVEVSTDEFLTSLESVLKVEGSGIDIYSSSLLDKKEAWFVLDRIKEERREKRCLVLYDARSNRNDAVQTGELLRHFQVQVELKPLESYVPGLINKYHNVFYVGTEWRDSLPPSFIDDLLHLDQSFCWLGFNIQNLFVNKALSRKLGLEYLDTVKNKFKKVSYKNVFLPKQDPWTTKVKIEDEERCQVLATAHSRQEEIPYAVRSGRNFWFFADIPTSYTVEGGRYLVFADLLHEILNENHIQRHLALVRIEDVHPLSDPVQLKKIARYLHDQRVPFQVSFLPHYIHPQENINVLLSDKPELISALKYMVRKGGTMVMHGVTHQRFGESTTDYEFWDPVNDAPREGWSSSEIRRTIERGIKECWINDIYPLLWETPHYAGSKEFYSVISDVFSIAMERRQAIDEKGTDQILPYAIFPDRYGQIIIPENLGYIPLEEQRAELVVQPARRMKVVRDGVASFFFHPFVEIKVLKSIVETLKREGYNFTNCAGLPIRVNTAFGEVTSYSQKIRMKTKNLSGEETKLLFPGFILSEKNVVANSQGVFEKEISLPPGELYSVHFLKSYKLAQEEKPTPTKTLHALQNVSNYRGEECQVPLPLLLVNPEAEGELRNEMLSFQSVFELIGAKLITTEVKEFNQIPLSCNLLIIPSSSSNLLNPEQIEVIWGELEKGNISLITSGFTPLADRIGIENTAQKIKVQSVKDTSYPQVRINWKKSVSVPVFEAPGDAVYHYVDRKTNLPLVVSASAGGGEFIFLGTLLDGETENGGTRFPYFLTHALRTLKFFPLVRRSGAEVFFNPAEREGVSVEELVKFWKRSGVKSVYAAGWQVFPEWSYDYKRLINLSHQNSMLVYAWLEPPYINEKFWLEHPQWREKNPWGEDAVISWRKPMALGDPQVLKKVLEEWEKFLLDYNWDGVILNRLGFESREGEKKPRYFTPFYPSVREKFKQQVGFDPVELFNPKSSYYWKESPQSLNQFKQFRTRLAENYAESLLQMLSALKSRKNGSWEIILTHDKTRPYSGIDLSSLIKLKNKYGVKLQLIPEEENKWALPKEKFDIIQLSIHPQDNPFIASAPTNYPTGIAFYTQLYTFINNHQRFSLFSESSLYQVDTQMLPLIQGSISSQEWTPSGLLVHTPHSGEVVFSDQKIENLLMDNSLAGSFYQQNLLFPVGEHLVELPSSGKFQLPGKKSKTRVVDFSGDLVECQVKARGIVIDYRDERRTVLVINERPLDVYVSNRRIKNNFQKGYRGWSLILPPGENTVKIITKSTLEWILNSLSLTLSNMIVFLSAAAILSIFLIFMITQIWPKVRKKRE